MIEELDKLKELFILRIIEIQSMRSFLELGVKEHLG